MSNPSPEQFRRGIFAGVGAGAMWDWCFCIHAWCRNFADVADGVALYLLWFVCCFVVVAALRGVARGVCRAGLAHAGENFFAGKYFILFVWQPG